MLNKITILVLLILLPIICEANSMFKLYNFQEAKKTKEITLIFKKQLENSTQLTNRVMFLNNGEKIFISTNILKSTIRKEKIIAILYESIDDEHGLLTMSYLTRKSSEPSSYFKKEIEFGQISKKEYVILKKRYCKNIIFEEI